MNAKHGKTQLTPLQMACSHAHPDVETIRSFLDKVGVIYMCVYMCTVCCAMCDVWCVCRLPGFSWRVQNTTCVFARLCSVIFNLITHSAVGFLLDFLVFVSLMLFTCYLRAGSISQLERPSRPHCIQLGDEQPASATNIQQNHHRYVELLFSLRCI